MNEKLHQLLDSILGSSKSTARNNVAYFCPFHHHTLRKLEINLDNQHYHCWSCNIAGKKLSTLFKRMNCTRSEFAELYKIVGNVSYLTAQVDYSEDQQPLELPKEYIPLYKKTGSIEYKNAIHYLLKRGITLAEIVKYNLGYCETGRYSKKIIVPSYDSNGKLNFFIARAYYNEIEYKHDAPDVSKDIVGFELFINWQLPIVLVEGAFDAMAVRRNCIPLFGKTLSAELRKKIVKNKVKDVYICLDPDAQKHALKHAQHFMDNGVNVYFVNLHTNDPSKIGFIKMCKLIKEAKLLTFADLIKYKLKVKI